MKHSMFKLNELNDIAQYSIIKIIKQTKKNTGIQYEIFL